MENHTPLYLHFLRTMTNPTSKPVVTTISGGMLQKNNPKLAPKHHKINNTIIRYYNINQINVLTLYRYRVGKKSCS
jgi:hypothetical protein